MVGDSESEHSDETAEGGPVKSFLEHLEDFRWLLVKCAVTLGLAMLICLVGANYVIGVIKWPLTRAKISWPGTNQVVSVSFGTNHLSNLEITLLVRRDFKIGKVAQTTFPILKSRRTSSVS